MEDKIIQAGVRAGVDFGDSADWLGIENAVANDAKFSATFAHQNVTAGEKGHAERPIEGLCDDGYFDLVLLSGIENERTIAQGSTGKIDHIALTVEDRGKYRNADQMMSHTNTIRSNSGLVSPHRDGARFVASVRLLRTGEASMSARFMQVGSYQIGRRPGYHDPHEERRQRN